jgi:Leucine-rich repeat (LRR) protein
MSKIQEEIARRVNEIIRQGETELNLAGLGLASVPESVAELTNLTILNLADNRLTELPGWMGNLTQLTTLRLDGNQLAELPDWMAAVWGSCGSVTSACREWTG